MLNLQRHAEQKIEHLFLLNFIQYSNVTNLTLSCTFTCFHDPTTLYHGKHGGKVEITCQKQLLPFPLNVFYPVTMTTTGAK